MVKSGMSQVDVLLMHVMMDSQVFNDILSLCGIQDLVLMSGCIVFQSLMLLAPNCLLCNSR